MKLGIEIFKKSKAGQNKKQEAAVIF